MVIREYEVSRILKCERYRVTARNIIYSAAIRYFVALFVPSLHELIVFCRIVHYALVGVDKSYGLRRTVISYILRIYAGSAVFYARQRNGLFSYLEFIRLSRSILSSAFPRISGLERNGNGIVADRSESDLRILFIDRIVFDFRFNRAGGSRDDNVIHRCGSQSEIMTVLSIYIRRLVDRDLSENVGTVFVARLIDVETLGNLQRLSRYVEIIYLSRIRTVFPLIVRSIRKIDPNTVITYIGRVHTYYFPVFIEYSVSARSIYFNFVRIARGKYYALLRTVVNILLCL